MTVERKFWIVGTAAVILGFFPLIGTNTAAKQMANSANPQEKMPASVQVKIDNFMFGPMSLKVAPGTMVTWTNADDVPHTVVSDDTKTFKSRALDTDEKFSYTFTKPGKYSYFCSVHPKMTGEVIVE